MKRCNDRKFLELRSLIILFLLRKILCGFGNCGKSEDIVSMCSFFFYIVYDFIDE